MLFPGRTKNRISSIIAAKEVVIPVSTVKVINLATIEWVVRNADLLPARKSWNKTE